MLTTPHIFTYFVVKSHASVFHSLKDGISVQMEADEEAEVQRVAVTFLSASRHSISSDDCCQVLGNESWF